MDNSQRFDDGQPDHLLAVDFSVFMARETMLLSKIGSALGEHSAASDWAKISTNISAAIHSVMWDDTTQLYHDVHAGTNGAKSPVKAVTGFLPLWLPDIPLERLDMLMATMNDPKTFKTAVPLPSASVDTTNFSTDMWRGPMWLNTNWMVALGLKEHGRHSDAVALMQATLDCVQKYYDNYGVIFEFYDSQDTHDPRTLLRKGAHSGGVRDYHWSAAITSQMILAVDEWEAPTSSPSPPLTCKNGGTCDYNPSFGTCRCSGGVNRCCDQGCNEEITPDGYCGPCC